MVLGRLDPEHFLGGDLKIDASLSEKAIREHIAGPLGLSLDEAALGILRIVNNNMALAINANSVAKGVDPRNFTLMGFGGAGPLHSVSLAEAIFAKRRDLAGPARHHRGDGPARHRSPVRIHPLDADRPRHRRATSDFARVNADPRRAASARPTASSTPTACRPAQRRFRQVAECRYLGQGFELRADMPDGPLDKASAAAVIDAFFDAHKQVYGHAFRDQSCEMVTLRVVATAPVEPLRLPKLANGGRRNPARGRALSPRARSSTTARRWRRRATRATGCSPTTRSRGPALVVQHNSTTLVPPGYRRDGAWPTATC